MARRNHTDVDSCGGVPQQMSSSFSSFASGPGFISAACACSGFMNPGDSGVPSGRKSEAVKVNTWENQYCSFSVGVNDTSARFSKATQLKKLFHINRSGLGPCKQSRVTSQSRSNNAVFKNTSKSATDCKNSLESAMKNLSMNDKGTEPIVKDHRKIFEFRGVGKENVSATANADCHGRNSQKENANSVLPSRSSDFGVFTFNANLRSHNVLDGSLFSGDSSKKVSNHENGHQPHCTSNYYNNVKADKFPEGIPEFRIGNSFSTKGFSKKSKATYRWKRKQKISSTQEEMHDSNHSTNNVESPSYSPMQYSPCEKISSGEFLADEESSSVQNSSGFVFALGTTDNDQSRKATTKRRLKQNQIKKTPQCRPLHTNSYSHTEQVQYEEKSDSNHESGGNLDFVDECEQWRERGNEALVNGQILKAEEFYTKGITEAASGKPSESLVACYCDRASARVSLGNIQEAINDSVSATSLNPNSAKANLTAANCYLLMGESNKATTHFQKCLQCAGEVCLDRRVAIEAANGLHNSQKLAALNESGENSFDSKSPDTAENGLEAVEKALLISPYSEDLIALKAWFMLMLARYEEAIGLCGNTLQSALKNCVKNSEEEASCKIWRLFLTAKCYFFMGSLQKSHYLVEKVLRLEPLDRCVGGFKIDRDSILSFESTVRDLISQKSAGNEAFKAGNYLAAIDHYNNALSANVQSLPFTAICFCNRAAAYQGLGQIADAIADCSLAVAVEGNYAKALARRSMLYEMIRDYDQAAIDQRKYASLVRSTDEQREADRRLSLLVDSAKNETSLDLYLILGASISDSASDIKKAYRKAALRHHPDKACQNLGRCESNHEAGKWAEILKAVRVDADKLFKMIGHANSVLSDPSKKQQYDADEEKRKRRSGAEKESRNQPSGGRRHNNRNKWAHENCYYYEPRTR